MRGVSGGRNEDLVRVVGGGGRGEGGRERGRICIRVEMWVGGRCETSVSQSAKRG